MLVKYMSLFYKLNVLEKYKFNINEIRSRELRLKHQVVKGHHRMARRRLGGRICRRRQPPLAHPALEKFVRVPPWRDDLGDNAVAIGDHDRIAGGRQTDIFAELVLQHLQTHGAHRRKVASAAPFRRARRWRAPHPGSPEDINTYDLRDARQEFLRR